MVAVYARVQKPLHVDIIVVGADDQDFHFWETCVDLPYGRDRFEVRHGDIGDQALDGLLLQSRKNLRTVFRLEDYLYVRNFLDNFADPGSYNSMIIGQQDTSILHKNILYHEYFLRVQLQSPGQSHLNWLQLKIWSRLSTI